MKFSIEVDYESGPSDPWTEEYDNPRIATAAEAREWAFDLIQNFNRSLRTHEQARKLVRVIWPKLQSNKHDWEKVNFVTLMQNHMSYDRMRCRVCGLTGKRRGMNETVNVDPQYRSKGYESCAKAKLNFQRKRERANGHANVRAAS